MVWMDLVSGIVVLLYLLGIHFESLPLIFIVSMLRSAVASCYQPVSSGMMPLLIPDARDLQIGITMNTWAWSCSSIVGGLVAGFATAKIGLSTCYLVDFITFLCSAGFVYWGIQGNFNVSTLDGGKQRSIVRSSVSNSSMDVTQGTDSDADGLSCDHGGATSPSTTPPNATTAPYLHSMPCEDFQQVYKYLTTCGFGMLVFLLASASLVWGIEDIVGASFSTVRDPVTGEENKQASAERMGYLFCVVGCGCMTGPMIVNTFTNPNDLLSMQRACIIGLSMLTAGWCIISFVETFEQFLMGTFVRTIGSGIAWMYANLILQEVCDKNILGRVLAVQFTLATLSEALSSSVSGSLQDAGYSKNDLARIGAMLGMFVVTCWTAYYIQSTKELLTQGHEAVRTNDSDSDGDGDDDGEMGSGQYDDHGIALTPTLTLQRLEDDHNSAVGLGIPRRGSAYLRQSIQRNATLV